MNTSHIKQSHNIVDYINQYVSLKQTGGGEFVGLCPFHSEKSPSFTVSESKQFYHCFGCGANGDVIKFVEEYQGAEFIDACKILGGQADEMDVRTVAANRARPIITYPKFDKRNAKYTQKYIDKCEPILMGEVEAHQYKGEWLVPVIDMDTGENVNLYNVRNGKFLCGGVSHRAASVINRGPYSTIKTKIICVNFSDALKLAIEYDKNDILIAHSPYNLKLIVDNIKGDFIPAISADDTHAHSLTNSHAYIFIDEGTFTWKLKGEDFEDVELVSKKPCPICGTPEYRGGKCHNGLCPYAFEEQTI